jgi:hypothetical protein
MKFWTESFLSGENHAAPTLPQFIARNTLAGMVDLVALK